MPSEPRPAAARFALLLAPLAGAVAAGSDALLGLRRPGAELGTAGALGAYLLAALGCGALLGLLLAVSQGALLGLIQRLPQRPGRWLSTAAVFCLLVLWNRRLFAGDRIARHAFVGLMIAGAVVLALGLAVLCARLVPRILCLPRPRAPLALFCGAAALGLLEANARLYPGPVYRYLHEQEVVLATLLLQAALFYAWRGWRQRPGPASVACGLLVGLCLLAPLALLRDSPRMELGRAALATRSPAATDLFLRVARRLQVIPAPDRGKGDADLLLRLAAPGHGPLTEQLVADVRRRGPWNVLILALDTVRADATGFGGRSPSPTPVLDRLAAESVVFERAYTPYPTSSWAFSALLNGIAARSSPATAVTGRYGWTFAPEQALPGLLAERGWQTLGISAFNAETLADETYFGHLKAGFQVFNPDQRITWSDATKITDDALKVLRGARTPWMAFVHSMDAHFPYRADPLPGHPEAMARYLGEVALNDREAGRLLANLDLGRTILIVLSDHGEEFFEHNGRYHNSSLYEEQARVPLLVRIPGVAPRRVSEPVSLLDVVPTLTELLDLEDPCPRLGRSLVPFLAGSPDARGFAYAELFRFFGRRLVGGQRAVWLGSGKLIQRRDTGTRELYDLARDGAERRNLLGTAPALQASLEELMAAFDARIDGWHAGRGKPRPGDLGHWKKRTDELLAAVLEGSGDRAEAVSKLELHLLDHYGELHPESARLYDRDAVGAMFVRVLRAVEEDDVALRRVIYVAGIARLKPMLPELRRLWERKDPALLLPLAVSLGMLGDGAGRDVLLQAIRSPACQTLPAVAIALAALGEKRGAGWLIINLNAGWWTEWAATMRVLHVAGFEHPSRWFTERLYHEATWPPGVARAALEALATDTSENATCLLLTLALTQWAEVRGRARELLARRLGPDALLRELEASAREGAALLMTRGAEYGPAVTRYRSALDHARLFRSALRLRMAHVLRLDGRADAARVVLEEVASGAPEAWYRDLARARLRFVDHPVQLDATNFGARVTVRVPPPARLDVPRIYSTTLELTNTGSAAWTGGPARLGLALEILYEQPDGERTRGAFEMLNWLPPEGVLPGETVLVEVAARTPSDRRPGTPVLVMTQTGSRLPRAGLIHRFR